MNKILILFLVPLLFAYSSYGQCPDPTPAVNCDNSVVFCPGFLDGFVSVLPDTPNPTGPNPLCNGAFAPNNTHWIDFVANSTRLTFQLTGSNCFNGEGIQAGILYDCGDQTLSTVVCSGACPGPNPIVLTSDAFTPGQRYSMWIDGCVGAVCEYAIDLLDGELGMDIKIEGADQVCKDDLPKVFTAPIPKENCGAWFTDPPLNFVPVGGDSLIINDWEGQSNVKICLDLADYCGPNPVGVICKEVIVGNTIDLSLGTYSYCPEDGGFEFPDGTVYTEGSYTLPPSGTGNCDTVYSFEVVESTGFLLEIDTVICLGDSLFVEGIPFTQAIQSALITLPGTTADGCQKRLLLDLEIIQTDLEFNSTPELCNNFDGSLEVVISGDDTPYTILWSDPMASTTTTVMGLTAGYYEVTVTGESGCATIAGIDVENLNTLASTTTAVDLNCYGDTTGTISVVGNNGTPGYTYQWDSNAGNQTTSQVDNLGAGIYLVTITDANGCTVLDSAIITEPAEIIYQVETTPASTGQSDGSALIPTIIGGIPPYQISWLLNPPVNDVQGITDLAAGTYEVLVVDANGCEMIQSFEIGMSTATNNPLIEASVLLFPNPNRGDFYLNLGLIKSADIRLSLVNALGQQVPIEIKSNNAGNLEIEVLEQSAGWFMLMISDIYSNQLIASKPVMLLGEF